jgi:hypothetical protein
MDPVQYLINNYFSSNVQQLISFKPVRIQDPVVFLHLDPGSYVKKFSDPDPGSWIEIPDSQHWFNQWRQNTVDAI